MAIKDAADFIRRLDKATDALEAAMKDEGMLEASFTMLPFRKFLEPYTHNGAAWQRPEWPGLDDLRGLFAALMPVSRGLSAREPEEAEAAALPLSVLHDGFPLDAPVDGWQLMAAFEAMLHLLTEGWEHARREAAPARQADPPPVINLLHRRDVLEHLCEIYGSLGLIVKAPGGREGLRGSLDHLMQNHVGAALFLIENDARSYAPLWLEDVRNLDAALNALHGFELPTGNAPLEDMRLRTQAILEQFRPVEKGVACAGG